MLIKIDEKLVKNLSNLCERTERISSIVLVIQLFDGSVILTPLNKSYSYLNDDLKLLDGQSMKNVSQMKFFLIFHNTFLN